jgi:hypothetical protein
LVNTSPDYTDETWLPHSPAERARATFQAFIKVAIHERDFLEEKASGISLGDFLYRTLARTRSGFSSRKRSWGFSPSQHTRSTIVRDFCVSSTLRILKDAATHVEEFLKAWILDYSGCTLRRSRSCMATFTLQQRGDQWLRSGWSLIMAQISKKYISGFM